MKFVIGILILAAYFGLAWVYRWYLRRLLKKQKDTSVFTQHIARVRMHPVRCPVCKKPLEDQDLVIYSKKGNWQGDSAHASCLVILRHPDGSTTRVDGKPVQTNLTGGILEPLPPGAMLLTEDEWEAFAKHGDTQEIISLSLPQVFC